MEETKLPSGALRASPPCTHQAPSLPILMHQDHISASIISDTEVDEYALCFLVLPLRVRKQIDRYVLHVPKPSNNWWDPPCELRASIDPLDRSQQPSYLNQCKPNGHGNPSAGVFGRSQAGEMLYFENTFTINSSRAGSRGGLQPLTWPSDDVLSHMTSLIITSAVCPCGSHDHLPRSFKGCQFCEDCLQEISGAITRPSPRPL